MRKLGVFLLVAVMLICGLPKTAFAAEITSGAADLTAYLNEISEIRGFDVSQDSVDLSLSVYGKTEADFSTTKDLKTFLGEVINADLSNLTDVYGKYNLDQDSLTQLLSEYGEDLSDYVFIKDLDSALDFYTANDASGSGTGSDSGIDLSAYLAILSQFGLSDSELANMQSYFESMSDYLSSSEVQIRMENLINRFITLYQSILTDSSSDSNYKLSDSQMSELVSIYNDMFSTLKLKFVFSTTVNGVETQYTLEDLLKEEGIDNNADYKLAIYDDSSNLLADVTLTADMLSSELGNAAEDTSVGGTGAADNNAGHTIKGGELPKTAGNYIPEALLGLFILAAGILVYRKVRKDEGEISEE